MGLLRMMRSRSRFQPGRATALEPRIERRTQASDRTTRSRRTGGILNVSGLFVYVEECRGGPEEGELVARNRAARRSVDGHGQAVIRLLSGKLDRPVARSSSFLLELALGGVDRLVDELRFPLRQLRLHPASLVVPSLGKRSMRHARGLTPDFIHVIRLRPLGAAEATPDPPSIRLARPSRTGAPSRPGPPGPSPCRPRNESCRAGRRQHR